MGKDPDTISTPPDVLTIIIPHDLTNFNLED